MPNSNFTPFSRRTSHDLRTACLFILPLVVLVVLFILVPVLGTFVNSMFQDVSFVAGTRFHFFEHYHRLWTDPGFFQALRFTLLFILVSVPLELILGLAFAMLLNEDIPCRGLLRGCVLIPWAIPAAISQNLGADLQLQLRLSKLHLPYVGAIGRAGELAGYIFWCFFCSGRSRCLEDHTFCGHHFFGRPTGYTKGPFCSGPDGSGKFLADISKITLPILRPIVVVALLFRTIDALRVFDLIYVLTHGGPGGSTASVSHYAYTNFNSGDFGYGSTISVVLFLIAFMFSIVYVKAGKFSTEGL